MKFLGVIFSPRHMELKIVLATLAVLISLPAISVVVIASSGLSVVSSALVQINPVTKLVEIFDPNGSKVTELQLSTTWPARGYVSSEFGATEPFRSSTGKHTGIDIANLSNKPGDPVTPFAKGKVTAVHDIDDSLCGKYVKLDHGFNVTSLYCHLDSTAAIPGTDVSPGDVIGYMGTTGFSTGVHVHLGIFVYGIAVNPRTFLSGQPEPIITNGQ